MFKSINQMFKSINQMFKSINQMFKSINQMFKSINQMFKSINTYASTVVQVQVAAASAWLADLLRERKDAGGSLVP
jgi:uncharacterized protein YaaQ